jgi:hypothetical protein
LPGDLRLMHNSYSFLKLRNVINFEVMMKLKLCSWRYESLKSLILTRAAIAVDLVVCRKQNGVINLDVLSALYVDMLSVHRSIGHKIARATSYYIRRLCVDVYVIQQSLQGWDNFAVSPTGCQCVDPYRNLSRFKRRDKPSSKTENSMFTCG